MTGRRGISISLLGSLVVTGAACATEPASITAGAFDLYPTIGVSASSTDNLFKTNDNEVSSKLYVINPRLEGVAANNGNEYSFIAEIMNGEYSETSEDDYTDFHLGGNADIQLNATNSVNVFADFLDTREARGTGFSEGGSLPAEPSEYEVLDYGLSYQFGLSGSSGRLVLDLGQSQTEYTNNRMLTEFRDRDHTNLGATFYLGMLPSTDFLVSYTFTDVDYVKDPMMVMGAGDSLDSEETYIYVGAEWEATALTSGSVKFGYGEKEFDDPDRESTDTPSWEVGIQWEPLTYSSFDISASKKYAETSGVGDAIEGTTYGLTWNHTWADRLSTDIGASYNDDEYVGSTREDSYSSMRAGVTYNFARWLDFGVNVSREERDSNVSLFDYDENTFSLSIEASL